MPVEPPVAPTAPPPPTPAPTPAPAPEPPPTPERDVAIDQFAEFDKALKLADTPPPTTQGKPAEAPTPAPAPAKEKSPVTKVLDTLPERPGKDDWKRVRGELDRLKEELKISAETKSQLEAKIRDAEARGKNTDALMERLAAVEKERDAFKGEISALKQEESPEFKAKFKQPFDDAAAYAQQVIEQLIVKEPDEIDPDTGEAITQGKRRPGTFADLQALFSQPIGKAGQMARQMFGDDAATVISHLNELHRLDHTYRKALESEKATWKQRQTEEQARQATQKKTWDDIRERVIKELGETNPDYHDSPDDKELVAARTEGYAIFDKPPATQQEAALKVAHVRHRVAAFGPMKLKILRLEQQLAAEKAKTKAKEKGEPGKTVRPTGGTQDTAPKAWEQEAREAMMNV